MAAGVLTSQLDMPAIKVPEGWPCVQYICVYSFERLYI